MVGEHSEGGKIGSDRQEGGAVMGGTASQEIGEDMRIQQIRSGIVATVQSHIIADVFDLDMGVHGQQEITDTKKMTAISEWMRKYSQVMRDVVEGEIEEQITRGHGWKFGHSDEDVQKFEEIKKSIFDASIACLRQVSQDMFDTKWKDEDRGIR